MIQMDSQEMISPDEAPVKQNAQKQMVQKHKALVNMTLAGGTQLVEGEPVELSDEQLETLKANFGEGIKHILG